MGFPKNFVWGAAAASYQIEGSPVNAGGGLSVWDMLCREPGRIKFGHTGDVACDHYNRYPEDVALMKEIGLHAYRMSIAWPRVLPEGTGRINEEGLAFYDKLVDTLLEAGVEPWVTLFHWDFPYDLFCKGGWLNRESAEWFAEYTEVIVKRLSDRVSNWMTLNEPQCFINLGHQQGRHAPGLKMGIAEVARAGHHALLAHGRSVQVIREHAKKSPKVSWAPVGVIAIPETDSPEDIQAAREAMFTCAGAKSITNPWDESTLWGNGYWADPVVRGHYPEDSLAALGKDQPPVEKGDMELIAQPIDFYGANIYNGATVRAGADGNPEKVDRTVGFPRTAIDWPVTPEALYWGPKLLHERYGLPVIVTENGLSCADFVSLDGKVHDPQRIDFLDRYLSAYRRAATDGVDVAGYFQWSIMDNFEWAEGYNERFGIIHVDYETQKRTMKDSAYWYRDVIASNGECLKG